MMGGPSGAPVVTTAGDRIGKGQLLSDLAISATRAFWGLARRDLTQSASRHLDMRLSRIP
jgi:hypothetical protein